MGEGRALTPDAVLADGEATRDSTVLPPSPTPLRLVEPLRERPAGLTERELDVLRQLSLGLTNAQIAERLVVSPRTVNAHLASIYAKAGVSTRAAAVRWAMEHDLA